MDATIQYTLFIILAPLAALISIGVIVYARLAYPSPETNALVWMSVVIAGWLGFNALELLSSTEAISVLSSQISYAFIAFTPVAWLSFALRYIDHYRWLAPRRFIFFCIIPALTTLIAWTNNLHNLLWTQYHFTPVEGVLASSMLAFNVDYGPWFWIHLAYTYMLVFLGAFLIVREYVRTYTLYQRQSAWVVIGALIPIAANVVYVLQLIPGLKKDFTSISFALASIAFAVGIFRYRLFDLRPVARHAVVDSMSDAMLAVDGQGRILDLNPAAATLIGVSSDQIIGQDAKQFPPWSALDESFWEHSDTQAEIELAVKGERHWFSLHLSALDDQPQQPTGRLVMLRDITDRVQAEADLLRYTAELESSNDELDAFAHTVAHDLKNPLASLIMSGSLLRGNIQVMSSEDITELLTVLTNKGQNMANIIDELLLLASVRKLEDITLAPLNTAGIVTDALDRLSMMREERLAEIIRPNDWPVAIGYAPWVEEVWVNYISNAIKYGSDPPIVELGADEPAQDPDGGVPTVRFWVRDNGPGIPIEAQSRIFTPFTRLEVMRAKGFGLGLSIVLRIMNKLGGEAGVESQLGEGSLFWFTLPADPRVGYTL